MKVIDNFLPKEYQDSVERTLLSTDFPWFFQPTTCAKDYVPVSISGVCETYHFTHILFAEDAINSNYFNLVQNIMYKLMLVENINTNHLLRIKANLTLKSVDLKGTFAPPHVDFEKNDGEFITCIYYVNDSDGDTLFFDSSYNIVNRVSPKKGRLIYFKGDCMHAKEPPQHHNTRCVINFNFKLDENK